MNYIVTSHYTRGTLYADEVRKLIASLDALGIEHDIAGVVDRGDWQANVHYKPFVIWTRLERYPERNVLYLDADAVVHRRPELAERFTADLAGHWRRDWELLPGTLMIGNTAAGRRLVREWGDQTVIRLQQSERVILRELVAEREKRGRLRVERWPAQYAKIFDIMKEVERPVIEHFQASRRAKANATAKAPRAPGN